ncbi:hypothetical protein Tco_1226031 [Tanacetum coccineum]
MVVQNQAELPKGSAMPTDLHHTHTIIKSLTQPQKTQKSRKPKRKDTQQSRTVDTIAQTRFENISKLSNDSLLARGNTLRSDEDRLKLNELMELCTNLQNKVLDLEKTKTTQANEIASLRRRVKKLEKKRSSRTHKLKRLYKVSLSARVESSGDEEDLGKDASKQGRRINDIDEDKDITLVNVQDDADNEMFDVGTMTGDEVFAEQEVAAKDANLTVDELKEFGLLKSDQQVVSKQLLEAVEKRFGGNATTKKTQRNLLKQKYENFTAPSSKMLDQTFNRLQKLVSQLELLDEKLSQEDVNQKLLRSLSHEWNTHAVMWRNKADLDTMSMDDLYNNLNLYEPKVKGMSSSSSSTQNMAFVSSSNNNTNSTNEAVNTAHGVSTASTQVNAANFTNIDNLSDAVICSFLASQPISDQAEEGPNYALMAFSSSSSDSELIVENKKSDEEVSKVVRKSDDSLIIED